MRVLLVDASGTRQRKELIHRVTFQERKVVTI